MRGLVLALALAVPCAWAQETQGPRMRADGPDAGAFGMKQGYPSCKGLDYLGDQRCRVGAFSHFDTLFASRKVRSASEPSALQRAPSEPPVRYTFDGKQRTLDDYLNARPVSGFLVAKGDTVLVERYQYGRNDRHRLTSFSMAKTVTGLLVGLAVQDGAIKSVDDRVAMYVRELRGTEYGRTPIRALLQMASGVRFDENYADTSSDIYRLANIALSGEGSLAAVKVFNQRVAEPGERFSYSSADTLVLGLVVAAATGKPLADYASERLWKPLGAQADASWITDRKGQEITFAYYNAALRDWARLGLMLAHEGKWNGQAVVPRAWVLASTTVQPGSPFWFKTLKPSAHVPGYGYQTWLLATKQRTFAMRGLRGQWVMVSPQQKIVLVQTALASPADMDAELLQLWRALIGEE